MLSYSSGLECFDLMSIYLFGVKVISESKVLIFSFVVLKSETRGLSV
jgi:hypothetical protein